MKHVVKVILLLLNLLWGLLLVIGSYSAYFPSRIGTLVELLFPLNLFACIAFFFIWLAYNPRYIWVPLAALVISWGGIARYCPVHKPQPIDNSQPGIHTLYPYRIPTTHGMNFLSKYPATLLFDTVYSESSAIAIYQVKIEGHTVTVVNQHMESIGLTQTDKELYHEITAHPNTDRLDEIKKHLLSKLMNAAEIRNRQADLTAEKIQNIPGNIIVCGDFNDSPLSYSVRKFHSMGFRDAYNELGLGPGITYHANRFWFRIDHILYKGNMEARWLVRQRHKSSDHYPLVTRFVWENSENH